MIRKICRNYLERHRHPVNQLLHVIGLPVTFVAPVVCLIREEWWLALGCFLGGYALQFLGHYFEGNDAGELILIKKAMGKPYLEFGPSSKMSNRLRNTD